MYGEKKRRRKGSIKNAKFRREAVPGLGAPHGEGADLLTGCTSKRQKKGNTRELVNENDAI